MCWTLSPVVYVRMVRCIDKTLIQYVSAGPYNTRSGPQELPRPFRRNSAQAMRLFHKVPGVAVGGPDASRIFTP